jgi:hypothetical protein
MILKALYGVFMCCVLHVNATYHAGLYNVFFHGLSSVFVYWSR